MNISAEELRSDPNAEYMNDAQRNYFEQTLKALLVKIEGQIREKQELLKVAERPSDIADMAYRETERQTFINLIRALQRELSAVRYSLKSLHNGDYGYCEDTGVEIGLTRLMTCPTARFCFESQRVYEKQAMQMGRSEVA